MIEGFDKEIDFLLRQTAQGETASAQKIPDSIFQMADSNHLDADEISAFAENALPEKTRRNYILHLADCGRCRKGLSNIIALNAESQSEIIHAEKQELLTTTATEIPWYRRFFAVPTLAYGMGALVLLFAGIGIFTVLQKDSMNSQVSQVSEKQVGGGQGMSSDGEAVTQEVYSNRTSSNTAAMNSATVTNTAADSSNSVLSAKPTAAANANSMLAQPQSNRTVEDARKENKSLSEPEKPRESIQPLTVAPPPPPSDDLADAEGRAGNQSNQMQNQTTQNQTQIMPDTRNMQRAPMPAAKMRKQENESDELKKSKTDKAVEKTVIGGKNFTRNGSLWIDDAYRGQTTTKISRGTNQYKKLDSGLRGIVENLGGTVVIVWKEKAYRIQ